MNGDGRKGPLKDDRRWVLCGGVGVVVLCKLDERGETRPRSDVMWTSEACELINASWKPDAITVSICSLYTIKKRFSGNRESCHFWFRLREFAAKREFRSLFDAVRIGFGGGGRQNSGISHSFCLLRGPRGAFLKVAVDKIQVFLTVFVYFERCAGHFWRWR